MSSAHSCSTTVDYNVTLTSYHNSETVIFLYREAVGYSLYLASVSRPDILFGVNLIYRYVNNLSLEHVKRVIRYLIATKYVSGKSELVLFGFRLC